MHAKLESALKDSSAQTAIIADIESKLLASDDLLTSRTARLDSIETEKAALLQQLIAISNRLEVSENVQIKVRDLERERGAKEGRKEGRTIVCI